jgi:hypothetical protein
MFLSILAIQFKFMFLISSMLKLFFYLIRTFLFSFHLLLFLFSFLIILSKFHKTLKFFFFFRDFLSWINNHNLQKLFKNFKICCVGRFIYWLARDFNHLVNSCHNLRKIIFILATSNINAIQIEKVNLIAL